MAKVTKVISGTATGSSATTIYTVPTGKVARVECLLGHGIRTGDGSINWEGDDPNSGSNYMMIPEESIKYDNDINRDHVITSDHSSYTVLANKVSSYTKKILRYITYLKAGTLVTARQGDYSILVVEEDAG